MFALRERLGGMVSVRYHGDLVTESLLALALTAAGGAPEWAEELPPDMIELVGTAGDATGEVWLHLLGLALDLGEGRSIDSFLDALREMAPAVLMRHVVGANVPAWGERVPQRTLEAAAQGDPEAALQLLAAEGYYGGRAHQALPTLLQLGPDGTRSRILAVLEKWFDAVVTPHIGHLRELHGGFDRGFGEQEAPLDMVARVTGGLRYQPESYTDEIVLIPQFSRAGWQVLAQHEASRIIVFDAGGERRPRLEVLADAFAALGEHSRLEILRRLACEPGGVSDVARATGLAKSTVHRHMAILRRAGLVALGGQAWRYRYEVRPERIDAVAEELVALLIGQENR